MHYNLELSSGEEKVGRTNFWKLLHAPDIRFLPALVLRFVSFASLWLPVKDNSRIWTPFPLPLTIGSAIYLRFSCALCGCLRLKLLNANASIQN